MDTTVDDTFSSAVVSLDRSRRLMMSQFLQYVANFYSFMCIDLECAKFCFGGHDALMTSETIRMALLLGGKGWFSDI